MKNTMKTMILGFLVLTLALGFTSCGDKEDDPKPNTPTLSLDDFVGNWSSQSVVYEGVTFANECDTKWDNYSNINQRKYELFVKSTPFESSMNRISCGSVNPTSKDDFKYNSSTKILSFGQTYEFLISDVTPTSFKGKLVKSNSSGGHNTAAPANAIFTFVKQ